MRTGAVNINEVRCHWPVFLFGRRCPPRRMLRAPLNLPHIVASLPGQTESTLIWDLALPFANTLYGHFHGTLHRHVEEGLRTHACADLPRNCVESTHSYGVLGRDSLRECSLRHVMWTADVVQPPCAVPVRSGRFMCVPQINVAWTAGIVIGGISGTQRLALQIGRKAKASPHPHSASFARAASCGGRRVSF